MQTADIRIPVALAERSYEILITTDRLAEVGAFVAAAADTQRIPPGGDRSFSGALVVTDTGARAYGQVVVESLEASNLHAELVVVPAGEKSKCLDEAARLYDRLVDFGADRRTLVVAVGGGVVGDLAGFVAATFVRGVPLLQIPTTLLAQVDSSVGGKVGVNRREGKNLVGAFHQPIGVFIDTRVLASLPEREYRCGLAEVVKYGASLDADFFTYLEEHADGLSRQEPSVLRATIARCCQLKAEIVAEDERELTGRRAVLNYGHTFAHAFETLTGYEELRHGEAVAAGMMAASRLALALGRIDADVTTRQRRLLEALCLPTRPPVLDPGAVLEVMRRDKKAVAGRLRFVLPDRLGHVELVADVDPALVESALEEASRG